MPIQRCLSIGALVVGLGVILAACGSGAPAGESGSRTTVVGREMSFTPSQITAGVGQPLTVAFANEGVVEHDWAVVNLPVRDVQATSNAAGGTSQPGASDDAAPSVRIVAKPGGGGEVTFTPERAGRYTIVCTLPGHKEAGMMGMLTVVQ